MRTFITKVILTLIWAASFGSIEVKWWEGERLKFRLPGWSKKLKRWLEAQGGNRDV